MPPANELQRRGARRGAIVGIRLVVARGSLELVTKPE
jgi:hypothetical protein